MMNKAEKKQIQLDRMRYNKNVLGSRLVYLAILFNVFYFVSVYESDVGTWYYQALIGISIVYNLVFMLVAFLASEGVKNYKASYGYLLLGLGAGQIVRIFILPWMANHAVTKRSDPVLKKAVEIAVMESKQFNWIVVFLSLSALCCLIAGVTGIYRGASVKAHNAVLEGKKRNVPTAKGNRLLMLISSWLLLDIGVTITILEFISKRPILAVTALGNIAVLVVLTVVGCVLSKNTFTMLHALLLLVIGVEIIVYGFLFMLPMFTMPVLILVILMLALTLVGCLSVGAAEIYRSGLMNAYHTLVDTKTV